MKSSPPPRSARSLLAALLLFALAHPLQAQHGRKRTATPAPNTPESLGFSSQRLERLHAAMQQLVDQKQLAGIVTLLARHGKVVE